MDEPEQATREDRLVVVAVERIGAGRRADKEPGVEELNAGEDVGRGCRRAAPAEAPVAIAEEVTRAPAPQRARQGAEEEQRIHRFSVPRLGKTRQRRRAAVCDDGIAVQNIEGVVAEPSQRLADAAAGLQPFLFVRDANARRAGPRGIVGKI